MSSRKESRRQSGVYVIKLGGSVITHKDEAFAPRLSELHRLGGELANIYSQHDIGIVIGGGSYGHYAASIQRDTEASTPYAIHAISEAMNELAQLVADVLASEGVPTLVYPPHAICSPRGLKPNCYWELVLPALNKRVAPLTYGDVYPCNSPTGWCIVSGDELAMELACRIRASKVIYVSDVDGVLDSQGNLIEELRLNELDTLSIKASGSKHLDVTGGLKRKLDAIRENWCNSLREVWIVNGFVTGRIIGAIDGKARGTVIRPYGEKRP